MQDLDKRRFAERYAAGAKIRSELTRGRHPLPDIEQVSEFSRPFRELMGANLFNDIWSRKGLGRRERCLVAISLLVALNREELTYYIDMALDCGVTKDEIQEVLLQCSVYCGTVAGVSSFRIAEATFERRDKENL